MNKLSRVLFLLIACLTIGIAGAQAATITAIRAGRLIDPENGTASANQVILIESEKIKAVGPDVAIPAIKDRGPIKPGFYADLIAVADDPLTDIDTLRNVQFVMKCEKCGLAALAPGRIR